jgi:hypothetical protein
MMDYAATFVTLSRIREVGSTITHLHSAFEHEDGELSKPPPFLSVAIE